MSANIFSTLNQKIYGLISEPKDVYSAISPLHLFCQIFSIVPYNLVTANGKSEYKCSIWLKLATLLRGCIYVICVVLNIVMNEIPFFGSNFSDKLEYFHLIFYGVLGAIEIVFGSIFAQNMIQVFKNVNEIDNSFHALAVWVPYRRVYISIILHLIIWSLLLISAVLWENASVLFTQTPLVIFLSVLSIWPTLVNLLMELQYVHCLNILRLRYAVLNQYLEALVREHKTYNRWTTETNKNYQQEKGISKSILKSIEAISNPIFVIDKVTALHIKLSDTAILINSAFSLQLLVRIAIAFISIVTALFVIALNFSKQMNLNMKFTIAALSSALEVLAIVWITSGTCEEANKCPRLMHKIRNASKDTKLQDVIEIYSLQMYHNRLQFYVCGLFPLDYTLLYTIVAGATTYLVILIQFNNSDYPRKAAVTSTPH